MYEVDKIQYLQIGVQGENIARKIPIDMTSWVEELEKDGIENYSFYVLFKPYNDPDVYPMTVWPNDYDAETHVLTWTIPSAATQTPGVGYTEVRAQETNSGLVKKTRIIPTSVENSVSGNETDPPEVQEGWVTQILNAGTAAVAAAEDAEEAKEDAEAAKDAAEFAAYNKSVMNGIENTTGNRLLIFQKGYYRVFSDGTVVDITKPETENETAQVMITTLVQCQPGDTFTIRAKGGATTAAAWGFLNEDCEGIAKASSLDLVEGTITAPENAAYFIVNNQTSNNPDNYFAYKGTSVHQAFNSTFKYIKNLTEEDDLDDLVASTDTGWYYWTSSHVPAHSPMAGTGFKMLVLSNGTNSAVQIAYPSSKTANPRYRMKTSSGLSDWHVFAKVKDIEDIRDLLQDQIDSLVSNTYVMFTEFENGNINASTGKSSSNTRTLRSSFIPIDDFVSIKVTGEDEHGNDYKYQIFAYDAVYEYLGLGGSSRRDMMTRDDVLEAYPTAKYVRLKITGGDDETQLSVDDLDDYGYAGYIMRLSKSDEEEKKEDSGTVDIYSLIKGYADDDDEYKESFSVKFDLSSSTKIVSIVAQYEGDPPTIRVVGFNPSSGTTNLASPYYELGGTRESTRRSWRVQAAHGVITKGRLDIVIPEGTVVTIREASMHEDQRNRYNDLGIIYHGHTGSIAPANTVEAFQIGAELGYNSMITIPKFLADGTGVCFHDDSTISGDLCWIDGTAITGTDDKAISEYTYDEITEDFRIKSSLWGVLHVPTLDDYFRVCSLTGMAPILSIHSTPSGMFTGTTGATNFGKIKTMAKKWRVLHKLGIKSGNDSILECARGVFGTDARYIWMNGQTHDPYNVWSLLKGAGFIAQDATDLSECEYDLASEYFYSQTVDGADHYEATMDQIEDLYEKGFKISIAETSGMSGLEMKRLIGIGVTEFTVNSHISMGLDW